MLHHSMALRSDGSIASWGYDIVGLISDTPTEPGFTAIAGGSAHSLALRSDGSIVAWGQDYEGLVVGGVPAGNDFTAIAAGGHHSLALRSDGSIVSWGWDGGGVHTGAVSDTPDGTDFISIAGGSYFSMAIKSDGSMVSWGYDLGYPDPGPPTGVLYTAISGNSDNNAFALVTPVPVPSAFLLGILGLGVAGRKLRRREAAQL